MSILPSKDLGSSSSSSSPAPSQSPNPNHGLLNPLHPPPPSNSHHQQPTRLGPNSPPDKPQSLASLRISSPIDMPAGGASGAMASAAGNSSRSSKKVNEAGRRNGEKSAAYRNNDRNSHCYAASQDESGVGHHKPSHRRTSANGQTNTVPSAARKTQMVNANHLLNFQYDPISRSQPRTPPPRRPQKRKPYNKDLFLQANYKFVVLDTGNYAPESMDPDKTLRWEDIICLKLSTPSPVQCPVCLDDPLCPQITSCGHIFCFPCILRYLMGEDDHKGDYWKKCPLCFVMVSSKDLYTLYIENVKQHSVGDTAEFMLLTRQKDSFTSSLRNKQGAAVNIEATDSFSKFTFTSDVDISVRKAISDLDSWLAQADSGLVDDLGKLPYVCAAMEQLEQRRKHWSKQQIALGTAGHKCEGPQTGSQGSPPSVDCTIVGNETYESAWGSPPTNDGKIMWEAGATPHKFDGIVCVGQNAIAVESFENQESSQSSSYDDTMSIPSYQDRKEKDAYNFYQAVDGQHVILHPINMKCLLHHFGSYDLLPDRVSGKILQLETVTQSEDTRRRYRYLSHFSLTTSFQLCEIDLRGVLPPGAFAPYINEIKNRENQRKRLERKEKEDKIRAEAALQLELAPSNFASYAHDFAPTFSMDDFEALGSTSTASSSSSPTVGDKTLFANVARLGFAAAHDSPALKTDTRQAQPAAEVTSLSSNTTGTRNNNTSASSFANVITRVKTAEVVDSSKVKEVGKKGKKPNRVLLSTSGGRRY